MYSCKKVESEKQDRKEGVSLMVILRRTFLHSIEEPLSGVGHHRFPVHFVRRGTEGIHLSRVLVRYTRSLLGTGPTKLGFTWEFD